MRFDELNINKKVFGTNIFSTNFLAVILLSTGLMACSSTDDDLDPSEVIAELTELEAKFEPKVLWDNSVGDGVSDHFSRLKPIVAYNKVYSASREGDLVAIDQTSGEKLWTVDLSDLKKERGFFDSRRSAKLSGGPIAGINKIFIGNENGDIYALDAETGEFSWQAKVKGEIISKPAIDSGILVVNSASGVLMAFNAANGEELWKVEQDVPALTLRGLSPPVIASGGVIVGAANGSVGVYLLEKGQQGWTAEIGEATGTTELERVVDVDSPPVVFGDKIYAISSRGNLSAIELRTGRLLWKRQYSSYRQISISGNSIFITTNRGHVFALNRLDGLERWSNLSLNNRGVTGPAVVGDYVVVGDFEGYLHWLTQETGEIVARHEVDSSGIHSTPTVHDNIIYIQSRDGDLEAIETPNLVKAEL
jgi:outer membrane protein assembly factor BamB